MALRYWICGCALLLWPTGLVADIQDVRVLGTTPTQAILAYTAPDNRSCTLAVSTSQDYRTLVPDVDPALFAGANLDGRAGNVSNGRARLAVIGRRTVERDLSGRATSRALQAATTYYFKINCPSIPVHARNNWSTTAGGVFVTQTIPSGLSYGEPIPVDPATPGSYLYPSFSATDRTSSATDPHTGALVKNLTLPTDMTGGTGFGMTPAGVGAMCNPNPVQASNGKYGYHCTVISNSNSILYWIASDGEVRLIGPVHLNWDPNAHNAALCTTTLSTMFGDSDPNAFYCGVQDNQGLGQGLLLKGVYSGHTNNGDADTTNLSQSALGGLPNTQYTQMTPLSPFPRGMNTLMLEFDPKSAVWAQCCSNYGNFDVVNGKVVYYSWGQQDTLGWVYVFDPNQTAAMQTAQFGSPAGCINNPAVTGSAYNDGNHSGCITASTSTFLGGEGSAFRWSVLHAVAATPASALIPVTMNTLRMKMGLEYQVTLTSALSSISTPCSMAKPAGSHIADWPDFSWASGCSTITVSGSPTLTGGSRAGYPATIAALPQDLLSVNTGSYTGYEVMRLLDKGQDENTWYVQRQYYFRTDKSGNYCMPAQAPTCSPQWPNSSAAAGGTLGMLSPAISYMSATTGMTAWWDPVGGSKSTGYTNTWPEPLGPTHAAYISDSRYGRWTFVAPERAISGQEPARLINPPAPLMLYQPRWNGYPTAGMPAPENHPALPVTNAPDLSTFRQIVDNHPFLGCYPSCSDYVTSGRATLVSGQLYRITGTAVRNDYKKIGFFANSGSRAVSEVSGPSAMLTTDSATQFQWCVAWNAGECYAGSQPGDVYFNAPGIAPQNQYCLNNWVFLQTSTAPANDICVTPAWAGYQSIATQPLANDMTGSGVRYISTALGQYEAQLNFWNSRMLPDGSWIFTSLPDGSIKLFRVPPSAPDSVNRSAYISVQVTIPAVTGANNAVVQFGYAENGSAGSYYCTARQEACVAQNQNIDATQPFYFVKSEAKLISGTPCASGCTISVPAIPGRVLYYEAIYRDSQGNLLPTPSAYRTAVAVP